MVGFDIPVLTSCSIITSLELGGFKSVPPLFGLAAPILLSRRRGLDAGAMRTARVKVGRAFRAGDVVSKAARLVFANPFIMLPQLLTFIPTLLNEGILTSSAFSSLRLLGLLLSLVLTPLVLGAYPSMVKAAIEGGQLSVTEALAKSLRRFWTLLAATILVVLIVALGAIALVVPGIIFSTWYAYTFAAIMLEDKGALQGMAASKAFGRDKKGDTFLVFLAVFIVGVVLEVVDIVLSLGSPLLRPFLYALLYVPFGAWTSVTLSYTYIAYGPSSLATPEIVGGLIGDIRNSFKAQGLEYVSLSESSDPKKTVLTYKDGSGMTLTKEIGIPMYQLKETVTEIDAMHPEGLADYLIHGTSTVPAATGVPASGQAPPASPQSSGSFCSSCGSRVQAGAKFCASCGKPV